jgi:hypothetical protein
MAITMTTAMSSPATVTSVSESLANGKRAEQKKCKDSNPLFFHHNPFAVLKDSSALAMNDKGSFSAQLTMQAIPERSYL